MSKMRITDLSVQFKTERGTVKAVEKIGYAAHGLNSSNTHIYTGAHLNSGKILLDGVCNSRGGRCDHISATDRVFEMFKYGDGFRLKAGADGMAAVAVGIEKQVQPETLIPKNSQIPLKTLQCVPVDISGPFIERRAPRGNSHPGEVYL